MIVFVVLFVLVLFYNLFLYNFLFSNNLVVTKVVFENLQNDLERIGFPFNAELNIYHISILSSFTIMLLLKFFFIKNISTKEPLKIIVDFSKLFFIYAGSLFSILYILRLYSLSRGILIIFILLFPIVFYPLIATMKKIENLKSKKGWLYITVLFTTLIITFNLYSKNNIVFSISSFETTTSTSTTTTEPKFDIKSSDYCYGWLGSNNHSGCITGAKVINIKQYSDSLNNVVIFNNEIYILDVYGKIIREDGSVFLDISKKVKNRIDEGSGETGLFGLAFHPSKEYFLVSFSNTQSELIVEKYFLDNSGQPNTGTREIIFGSPGPGGRHFSGNLIWSNYFNDFLLSVGDMISEYPVYFNTTSAKGKILFLNSYSTNSYLISTKVGQIPRDDIFGFGLRNPWKTFEYKEYLFIPDIGNNTQEELNVISLEEFSKQNSSLVFGWPFFEASLDQNFNAEKIKLYKNNIEYDVKTYVEEVQVKPSVYYNHEAPENFRAAIIGGAVIDDPLSDYYENYIFTDYLSNELFAYDFKNNKLFTIPLPNLNTFFTSLAIHPTLKDTVLITSGNGELIQIQLP